MSRYLISPDVIRELNEIFDYFASRSVSAGERFVEAFENKCRYLIQFPNLGRSYADFDPSLRGVPLNGYILFYRVINDGIEIVRVVSGYRDLSSLFSDADEGN
ncbi:type II toxin-antitoxin system RelE/ParE family toxin [Oscillatoria sp. HE19RPO]|uniref:type II toxin-antitoxin system RelE/ParE family toxin n=1 Tax=Oscillatoria sp. HE19RPO TaxID=2954806 RepID=UPI0020C5073F|nr:type II toxin-antitoxin system RelE/ParE family toxin [Oscillatoria sp. HE19RPO]